MSTSALCASRTWKVLVSAGAVWATFCGFRCCDGVARADSGDAELLGLLEQTVVTTASKSTELGSDVPGTSTILTAEDLQKFGIHSLDEAIDFLSLGVVTDHPLHEVDVGARGVLLTSDQGAHFLVLVNGHAVNEPLFGSARLERGAAIPMEMIDHVEIVLGPGSVLYGSHAMFGVINVITKRARDFAGVHFLAETELGKSGRVSAGAGVTLPWFKTPTELTVAVESYRQSGPTFSFGPQTGLVDRLTFQPRKTERGAAGTGVWGGEAAHSYFSRVPSMMWHVQSGNLQLDFHLASYQRATPYIARQLVPVGDFDDPRNNALDRSMWADARYTHTVSSLLTIDLRGYGDSSDIRRQFIVSEENSCFYENVSTCRYLETGVSRWGGTEIASHFDWNRDGSLVSLVGVHTRLAWAGSKEEAFDDATDRVLSSKRRVSPKYDRLLGLYAQQTYTPASWVSLNGGARVDAGTAFDPVVSPRVSGAFHLWKGGTLKATYAEAFRGPSLDERSGESTLVLRSESLRPERVRSVESSIEQRMGAQRLFFGIFQSQWSDLIDPHLLTLDERRAYALAGKTVFRGDGVTQYQNIGTVQNFGWNAALDGVLWASRLHYGLALTGALARRQDAAGTDAELPVAPQFFGNARLLYDFGGDLPAIGVAAHWLGRRPSDRAFGNNFQSGTYAPAQVELRGTVSGKVPFLPALSYRASANVAVAERSAYVVGPAQANDASSPMPRPELAPVDRFRTTMGVQYDFR